MTPQKSFIYIMLLTTPRLEPPTFSQEYMRHHRASGKYPKEFQQILFRKFCKAQFSSTQS